MPASAMAARTAAAVASTCGVRPNSSGAKSAVKAVPMASAPAGFGAAASPTASTRKCGESPPSVPPDMTMAMRAATDSGASPSRRPSIRDSACTA